ncbi:hydantoinase/oxoprolinase family protein [Kaustia mangrovi]|uniref:Hydantoinase/oxoprolinase family protein n=1 Tax=Kaustia mangrovi TaxID=2593653 RepID=A0A7S8HC24_9HYPH|nr:hydantoinase/oxoprolinase family protein [Kaustia mangrovi]QPC43272.1 hydantoinase/oxoprolinase family protein [Kaustia mangrovi]
MSWFIGVDVGGTFTDFYAFDTASGHALVHKVPSTPDDPSRAILTGLDELLEREEIPPEAILRLAHGTTVATNALIQRRGAPVALVTTDGFRDLLEIGRQTRPRMYSLKADNPPPLVAREHRFEVAERVGPEGQVIADLTDEAIEACVEQVIASGAEACAVCLIFAFLAPDHERRIGEALKAARPDLFVSLSSNVQPEFREYERFSTTVINAYLQPGVSRYMHRLAEALGARAPEAQIGINQSSGGLMSVERAERYPIRTALSGPAAGAVGAIETARLAGRDNVITLDMGGTSADVCLIRDRRADMTFERDVAGFPVRLPAIDINTVGAGGGSIAHFGPDGLVKVGPASAGAFPGPACYGRGGEEPTVSDANLVLGRLSDTLIGGSMTLDRAAAEAAIRPIANRLGESVEAAAQGILRIVTANMVGAIRAVSVERGHDPRHFALMPFGGAGALHGVEVARALGIGEVIVPVSPGILCAHGLIVTDLQEDFTATHRLIVDREDPAALAEPARALAHEAGEWFAREDIPTDRRAVRLILDMRYIGQNYELRVPVGEHDGDGGAPAIPDAERLKALFFAEHERAYGHYDPDAPVEVMTLRLTAIGRLKRPPAPSRPAAQDAARPVGERPVWYAGAEPETARVYDRARLAPGHEIAGPAIVDQLDATTVLWPGDRARIDDALNLIIEVAND